MNHKKSKSKSKIKLHLGCGKIFIPGYIHIDQNDFDHIDYLSDVSDLSMFSDCTVDLIYACHVLEYFHRDDVNYVLCEWNRVLKKSGLIRVAVPDFESILKVYSISRDLNHRGILGPLYGKWSGGNGDSFNYHRTVYDFNSLSKILKEAKFKNISRYNWMDTEHAQIDDFSQSYIPHMDKENGIHVSLNLVCYK